MTGSLHAVEEEHGFTFGGGPNPDPRSLRQHVKCANPGCAEARSQAPGVPVLSDTVLPVRCGSCHAVLLCDHQPEPRPRESVSGTAASPVTVIATHCRLCGDAIDTRHVEHEPVTLDQLPAAALAALGVTLSPRAAG